MRRFVYLFIFIFAPGNTLLNLNQDCGGKILGERSGSIRPNSLLFNRITSDNAEKPLDVTCTWIIDAYENQTVWIEVISVGKGARIGIKFGNGKTLIHEREDRALFSGTGRTIIEWSLRRTDETFATLHLRWNTSEDSHTLALIPYTHSDADPVSPSPNSSNDVTYTPDIPVSSNAAPKTHTLREKTFQVLLQIVLEGDYVPSMGLLEVETFLHNLSGFQNQHVTWHSGPVLQTLVQFQTVEALSWLGRVESLLQEAGLNPLPKKGILVGGVRVKNITVGGLQTDVCEWLFECPSGFQCVSSKGNATCTSVCHSEYCKHQGICVHQLGQQPICQCPVGEDYWFMGQRCDLRMTRPRLVGVCFGVLVAVAAIMALLSYLTVRRFKTMLMQAKVEQTRSSYRRFNHFDELSARFWGRSWPGSADSLDNPAFTRSDDLLHMRALDRTCCYHDDTLSVVSTYHGSGAHLNTIYPHGSQYGWDLSNCSLADGVVDSGKASDLSVCSWPIEPIQWTPFPLLQQLNRNTTTVKASRPRSYCEGMELVDLEKSWTA
ncbi:hypothetical protein cypCar_00033588 [Cyprinus carpio]|nr:hypothetical protein cypCar_00033588 [Cyprinus carpio]